MGNIVAIVGRPNVGKSTFFNRLTESRQAIVDEVSGVTRDRHYGKVEWGGQIFSLIDTGGYIIGSDDVFEEEIRKQVEIAIEESNAILFMVDVNIGITDLDNQVASLLRKAKNKNVFLVVNKVDSNLKIDDTYEFYNLGLGEIYSISAVNGYGTGELLDEVIKSFKDEPVIDENVEELPKFSIVGRPNVGKSSLLNVLVGEERNIVTPIAGTTRDTINIRYNKFGFDFFLIDTAGIRKKSKVHEDLEFYSVMRSIRSIENCDVCLLMIDATVGFEAQDMNIYSLAIKNRKGIVIIINKWDLVEDKENSFKEFERVIKDKIAPFTDVPLIFISVKEKQRLQKILECAMKVHENRTKKIPTSLLNNTLLPIIEKTPPPIYKSKKIKIKFITQIPTHAPSFAFFCNLPQYVKEPYKRFIENRMRELFDFNGVPIQIFFRKK